MRISSDLKVPTFHEGEVSAQARPGLQLYKAMLAHQELEEVTSKRLPVSKMFTLISRRSLPPTSTCLHLPDYSLPTSRHCGRVNFTLRVAGGGSSVRRLELDQTPALSRLPVSMDLCTPLAAPLTPRTPAPASPLPESMELCTPTPSRGKRQEVLSLSGLSLLSPEKRSRMEDEEDLKKSEPHWFLLETSIRGFKLRP